MVTALMTGEMITAPTAVMIASPVPVEVVGVHPLEVGAVVVAVVVVLRPGWT
jgi:hypothetical protein